MTKNSGETIGIVMFRQRTIIKLVLAMWNGKDAHSCLIAARDLPVSSTDEIRLLENTSTATSWKI